MKIAVVGLGYVGHALCEYFSSTNYVYGYDIDYIKLDNKNYECGDHINYKDFDTVFLCLPTDFNNNKGELDTGLLSKEIGKILRENNDVDIYIKSTVNIGFSLQISRFFNYNRIFYVPEFLRERYASEDIRKPDRIIIGTSKKSLLGVKKYLSLFDGNIPHVITGFNEAEAIKLFSNSYLATRVAFFNEVDSFADSHKLNSNDIIEGVSLDHRIGNYYNVPGYGFGGYCLPKDTKALLGLLSRNDSHILKATIKSNYYRKKHIVNLIVKEIRGISNPLVGVYKIGYRNSPLIDIIYMLAKKDIGVILYDSNIKDDFYLNALVLHNIDEFKDKSTIIITENYDSNLDDIKDKVLTK